MCQETDKRAPDGRRRRGARGIDLTGQRFHMLTAMHPTDQRDRNGCVVWSCRCDCGREVELSVDDLKYGRIFSCGCYKRERVRQLSENSLVHVAGTSVNYLQNAKIRSDNKTGVKGVFLFKDRYIAEINFQGRCYRLGKFRQREDAIAARKKAEQMLHGEFLEFYQRWKELAEADPEWGKKNKISVKVIKDEFGELKVIMKPDI